MLRYDNIVILILTLIPILHSYTNIILYACISFDMSCKYNSDQSQAFEKLITNQITWMENKLEQNILIYINKYTVQP